ncbi:MAG: ribosome recycling factor [Chloroflexota bacterium]|nr:ribosome recycling factor [Dehalococcoidia bacterium]MDW8045990.1 ribosome recycling factor [Chloroflexota bacterium]
MEDPEEILLDAEERMTGAVEALRRELVGVRTGRAHPSLVEGIHVDYYGAQTPLKQLATISAPEPRLITIQVWDRNAVKAVEKAIQSSDLGLNPSVDGQTIRLPIPPLSEQRRKELVKHVHHRVEEARVAIRNVRRHAHDELRRLERQGTISQDDLRRYEEQLQKLTDRHIEMAEAEGKKKEHELLEV